jgi:hypothetical protein
MLHHSIYNLHDNSRAAICISLWFYLHFPTGMLPNMQRECQQSQPLTWQETEKAERFQ